MSRSAPGEEQPHVPVQAVNCLAVEQLGHQVDMNQPHTLEAKAVISILGYVRKHIASTWREVILLLCSALVRPIWSAGPFWAPQYKTDVDILEQAQKRAMKMTKGLEYLHTRKG